MLSRLGDSKHSIAREAVSAPFEILGLFDACFYRSDDIARKGIDFLEHAVALAMF